MGERQAEAVLAAAAAAWSSAGSAQPVAPRSSNPCTAAAARAKPSHMSGAQPRASAQVCNTMSWLLRLAVELLARCSSLQAAPVGAGLCTYGCKIYGWVIAELAVSARSGLGKSSVHCSATMSTLCALGRTCPCAMLATRTLSQPMCTCKPHSRSKACGQCGRLGGIRCRASETQTLGATYDTRAVCKSGGQAVANMAVRVQCGAQWLRRPALRFTYREVLGSCQSHGFGNRTLTPGSAHHDASIDSNARHSSTGKQESKRQLSVCHTGRPRARPRALPDWPTHTWSSVAAHQHPLPLGCTPLYEGMYPA